MAWRVQDVAEPVDALVPPDSRQPVIALAPHNLLPSSEAPELCIYQARPGLWMLEQNGETRALKDGDRLQMGSAGPHRFVAAAPMDDTQVAEIAREPEAPWLVMRLSLDEEHASLEVKDGAGEDRPGRAQPPLLPGDARAPAHGRPGARPRAGRPGLAGQRRAVAHAGHGARRTSTSRSSGRASS